MSSHSDADFRVGAWQQARHKPTTALIGLGVSFFGSLMLAACFYPQVYRWRQTVMSALSSPKDNPHAFGIACAGVAVSGLCLLPFVAVLRDRLENFAPKSVALAGRCLATGGILLTLTALVVPGHYRVLGVHRIHEQLARLSAACLCLALVGYLRAIYHLPPTKQWLRGCALVFVALPVAAFLVSRLALVLAWSYLPWEVYRAATISSWGSLALWEWIGAGCIYLFLCLCTLGLPATTLQTTALSSR